MKLHRKILTIAAILGLLFFAFRFLYRATSEEKQGDAQPTPEICNFQAQIPDLDGDGKEERFINCKEKIQLALSTKYYTAQDLDTVDTFYDLFFFVSNGNKEPYTDWYIPRELRTFPLAKPQFITVVSTFDPGGSTHKEALAIYKVNNQQAVRVFKKGFDEILGRWIDIDFFTDAPGFKIDSDVGYLGGAANRIPWFDFYYWNEDKQTFEIQNHKHQNEFRELLKWYEEADKECESISALYQGNPNRDFYCGSNEPNGYSKQNVESFLKAKTKIQEILSSP